MTPEHVTKTKICGITNSDDARLALSLGADYLGVIFAESPRQVDVALAREIRDAVPEASLVGVFMDASRDEIVSTVRACGLDHVQLHGDESPAFCAGLVSEISIPIIKTFRPSAPSDLDRLGEYQTTSFFMFDLDKTIGNGVEPAMRRLWDNVSLSSRKGFRVFLAGALDPSNVRAAVGYTRAYCVDVCRGVEKSPGRKDEAALARFMAEVRT